MKASIVGVVGVVLLGIVFAAESEEPRKKHSDRTLHVDDVAEGRVTLIGRLGVPVGTVVEVEGVWQKPSGKQVKFQDYSLTITAVNGNDVENDIAFEGELDISRVMGSNKDYKELKKLKKFRAFESFAYEGIPDEAWDERGSPVAYPRVGYFSRIHILPDLKELR